MIAVDRIERKFAVCETDEGIVDMPVKLIRGKVRDGVVIMERDGSYAVDERATRERAKESRGVRERFRE